MLLPYSFSVLFPFVFFWILDLFENVPPRPTLSLSSSFFFLLSISLGFNETMPFCEVSSYPKAPDAAPDNGIKIFYRTYGRGPIKVLLIIGIYLYVNEYFLDVVI